MMTPEAKKALATTVQSLRARLLVELHDAAESAWQLSIPRGRETSLGEAARAQRARFEAYISEQPAPAAQVRESIEKSAAYTLLNRLALLRLLEAGRPATARVVTGGWKSGGYLAMREMNPALVQGDDSEGYAFLLRLLSEELALDLPGLFGTRGVSDLIPVPTATLRHTIEALDAPELASCWTDDMTLGWIYQYWNDPEREALDAKLNAGGKVERHEIASKTQMFTERYMVDWLLQNSLGPIWLAMCSRHGWTPECVADGTLDRLEARRADWRARRASGEVPLTALMPVQAGVESRWVYYVPQPLPADAVNHAPDSVRDLRLLDPAVGSGHFLVVAFDLLFALYHEEARHRGLVGQPQWTDRSIVERILEHNLSGIDLDPRAVQIAAAALWLKARQTCPTARPKQMNLVASALRIGALADTDPARVELRREVERETGIPGALTDTIVHALEGADHLGSLLKVDQAVDAAIDAHEATFSRAGEGVQLPLFGAAPAPKRIAIDAEQAKATVLDRLERFLSRHTRGDDLGLRLRGEQLAAGVRFARLVQEGRYDLVVGNPPYQGTSKMADAKYVSSMYPRGKADLYAAFLERGLQLVKAGGTSALLTMRNWMFIKQYVGLRTGLLESYDLRALGDFAIGAFDSVPNDVLSVVVSVFRKAPPVPDESVALQPTGLDDRSYDRERTARKRAATLTATALRFSARDFAIVEESPMTYWWTNTTRERIATSPKLDTVSQVRQGLASSNNARFLLRPWETGVDLGPQAAWAPFIKGAAGKAWFEPLEEVIRWRRFGLEVKVMAELLYGSYTRTIKNENFYFQLGVAFSMIGQEFTGRAHRFPSVIADKGSSVYGLPAHEVVCLLNSQLARDFLSAINPSISFQVGDVKRLPVIKTESSELIFNAVQDAFTQHESHREPSVEFRAPGPSPWRNAQAWAQTAVDRAEGAPLPDYKPEWDPEPATDHVSFALGVALGRFDAAGGGVRVGSEGTQGKPPRRQGAKVRRDQDPVAGREGSAAPRGEEGAQSVGPEGATSSRGGDDRGEVRSDRAEPWRLGVLAWSATAVEPSLAGQTQPNPFEPLPSGILFLDGTLAATDLRDGLGHPAAGPLHAAWARYGAEIAPDTSLRDYLRLDFFTSIHRQMYENRPIHWPLSSKKKTFVAWVTIHRWTEGTLNDLLADHLHPAARRLSGEVSDNRATRDGADKAAARNAEKRLARLKPALDELTELIATVEQLAEAGPPNPAGPLNPAGPPAGDRAREVDARYAPDLDDGVMINAAALHPLLAPQWKDPAKWWRELSNPTDKKHYDWAKLAMRYWPTRVDARCRVDPSLGVAHGCFWAYHPGRAWAWELRLVDEIGPEFRIEEGPYRGDGGHEAHRAAWLRDHATEALAAVEAEALRRRRKKKAPQPELTLLEPGLWARHPRACWDLELAILEKQGEEFTLRAPDEPAARAALLEKTTGLIEDRRQRLAAAQQRLAFAAVEAEAEAEGGEETEADQD